MAITVSNTYLITEADLQAHTGMEDVSDARAEVLIKTATSRIKKFLARSRLVDTQADVTIYMDGDGSRDLFMPDGPITEITSLYSDVNRDWTSGDFTLDNDNIMIYGGLMHSDGTIGDSQDFPTTIRLLGDSRGFSRGSLNIRFVGRVGYNDANDHYPLPPDLEEACKQLCAWLESMPIPGIKSQRTQTYSYTMEEIKAGMPVQVRALLAPYKRLEVY